MKFLLITLFSTTVAFGQIKPNASIAHNKVEKYLKQTLNNPQSYNSLSWGRLATIKTDYSKSVSGTSISEQVESLQSANQSLETKVNSLTEKFEQSSAFNRDSIVNVTKMQIHANVASIDSLTTISARLRKAYTSKFEYYYIEHTFRAKNAYNARQLKTYIFILDRNYNIIGTEDKDKQDSRYNELLRELSSL